MLFIEITDEYCRRRLINLEQITDISMQPDRDGLYRINGPQMAVDVSLADLERILKHLPIAR